MRETRRREKQEQKLLKQKTMYESTPELKEKEEKPIGEILSKSY